MDPLSGSSRATPDRVSSANLLHCEMRRRTTMSKGQQKPTSAGNSPTTPGASRTAVTRHSTLGHISSAEFERRRLTPAA